MMLLCKISCSFSTKCSCYQVELLVFSTPTLSSRGLCWGTMPFLHLVGAMFYQTHGNSQSITFSFFSHSSCFLTLSFFSLLFLLKYSQTSVFLAFSVHPPLSSPLLSHPSSSLLHTRISCLRRPETAQLFSSSPEPLCWTCLDLFSASSQSSRTLKMTDEVRLAWEGRNRISYPKTMLIHNWPSNRCVCVCVCFLLRRTPKPASLIAQPAFHYVFKLPMHEEDEASEIYMFRLVAGGTRVYEVVLFPSGTSCSL